MTLQDGVKNIFDGDVQSGEQLSFPMNLASCSLEQMDIPESIDIIMKVISPVVFWNMIVSVVVCHGVCKDTP